MALYAAELRRRDALKADTAEAVAMGYAACKSEDGSRGLQNMVKALRRR